MSTAVTLQPGQNPAAQGVASRQSGTAAAGTGTTAVSGTSKLVEFEGFLQRAGHTAGVVLAEIVRCAIPLASVAAVADPAAAPAATAFSTSLKLVQSTVIAAQQRWVEEGSAANSQKLADVLEVVEQPIITMFAQAGMQVDTAYVTNLVNGVVAILNAQPSSSLATA